MTPHYTDAEKVARAEYIFLAHVFRLEEIVPDPPLPKDVISLFGLNASFRLSDSLKGDAPTSGTIATSLGDCYLPLIPGSQYVLFAVRDQTGQMIALPIDEGTRWFLPNDDRSVEYWNTLKRLSSDGAIQK